MVLALACIKAHENASTRAYLVRNPFYSVPFTEMIDQVQV
jgi:hypothetical protein